MLVMQRLAGVLLKVKAFNADADRLAARHVDDDDAFAHDRLLVLRNLVASRKVRIEIVLPVKDGILVDLRLEAQTRAHRLLDAEAVDHGQHAGHRRIDEADMRIGLGTVCSGGAREQLGLGQHLRMDFHADDDFPLAGRAFNQRAGVSA